MEWARHYTGAYKWVWSDDEYFRTRKALQMQTAHCPVRRLYAWCEMTHSDGQQASLSTP